LDGVSWIKLRVDMFDDEKIKIIQSLPEGDALLVIWIRLIALAGKCNANGLVLVEDEFPYSDEMLSVIFAKPLATVRLALKTFEKFHMIENTQKGVYITNFKKHQNVEGMERIREQNRLRKQRERAKRNDLRLEESASGFPVLPDSGTGKNNDNSREVTDMSRDNSHKVTNMSRDSSHDVTDMSCDNSHDVTDMSRDRSRDVTQQIKNKNKEIYNISSDEDIVGGKSADADLNTVPKRHRIEYRRIIMDFHDTCIDFPTIRAMSEVRKKKIQTLLNEFDKLKIWPDVTSYDKLHRLFQLAQDSDFLSGRDQKWNGCSFDWIINKTNALKIVEGNYENERGVRNARADTGAGNNGKSGNADNRPLEGTTLGALERYRRNAGAAEDL